MVSSPNMVHSMDAKMLNDMGFRDSHFQQQVEDFRYDRTLEIGGSPMKVSFLHLIQTIVFTSFDESIGGGTITLDRPFASKTPDDWLLEIEINHYLETKGE